MRVFILTLFAAASMLPGAHARVNIERAAPATASESQKRDGATDPDKKPRDDSSSERQQQPRVERREGLNDASALGLTEEQAFEMTLNEALRKPGKGETRVQGTLTRIECPAKSVVFHVRLGTRTLKLRSSDFGDIEFKAFTPEAGGELGCGPRKPESHVVVTYRAQTGTKAKDTGQLVAVEFVPPKFVLKAVTGRAAQ